MPYTPPDAATITAAVSRDLRDPDNKTFTTPEVHDLINGAIVEVGRIYPSAGVREMALDEDGQSDFPIDALSLFRVEVIRDGRVVSGIPSNMHATTGEGGWDLHAGNLWLPYFVSATLKTDDSPTIRAWGYFPRELFAWEVPDEVLDSTDGEFEYGVRLYAVLMGYQRLQNDRLLFQQWLTNTGATDVSPNQLAQTADMYQSQWGAMRQRLRRLQRV